MPASSTSPAGVPFLPLQTLWINFTTLLFQAIGLGYGKPADGLMQRKPRPPEQPILSRSLLVWLVAVGLVVGVGTLAVISWAEQNRTEATAHTMGVVTFSVAAIMFSIVTRDELRSTFSLDTFADRTFTLSTLASALTLVLSTVLDPLERLLSTTSLDARQWGSCALPAVAILVMSELRKAALRRTGATADHALVSAG